MGGIEVSFVAGELAASQHKEGDIQSKEKQEEHDGGAQRAEKQDGGEDEPAGKEDADSRSAHLGVDSLGCFGSIGSVLAKDVPGRSKKNGIGDPEATERRESSSTEGVANSHFPGDRC